VALGARLTILTIASELISKHIATRQLNVNMQMVSVKSVITVCNKVQHGTIVAREKQPMSD
jgi:hypothetical protein